MKRFSKKTAILIMSAMVAAGLCACGPQEKPGDVQIDESLATEAVSDAVESEEAAGENAPATEEVTEASESEASHQKIASVDEKAEAKDVVDENMEAIPGSAIKDGEYEIEVESSSSMFNIASCVLTVAEGEMTANMVMGGTGYAFVYPGTPEEAAAASEDSLIPYVELESGEHSFTIPVKALDAAVDCAAFSKKKEQWYDRILVFKADSLPEEAFLEKRYATVEDLGIADGEYQVNVTLEGGSGRASVESPAKLRVENGVAYATITWSSSNYDYMLVGEEKYLPINEEGNSVFEIPITGFDYKMPVKADTTAMSTPKEIEYTLYFESELQ